MSIIKGIVSNGLANIVQKLVRIADQLFLVPFFLTHWGAAMYGEWLTLTIIPSVLAFSDLGFGSAVSNSFVLAYAAGDKQKAADLRKSGFWIISLSVFIGIILSAVAMIVCDQMHLFDKSQINGHDAILAVIFMMIARLLSFYNQLIEGFFRGARKAAMGSLLGSANHLIGIAVGITVLSLGYGVVAFAISNCVVSIVHVLIYSIIGAKLVSFDGHNGRNLKSDIGSIVKKGMGYMMTPIWQCIYFQGTTFAVRLALGPEAVALFNTIRTVCRSVNQLFSVINASIFPDLQYEYGQGHHDTVRKYFRVAVILSMFVGLIGFVGLSIFGLDIYGWWTQSVLAVPRGVWYIFMVGVLLNAVWWTSTVTYRMTNKPYHLAVASTLTAVISVGLTYALAIVWGEIGAAIGSTLFELVMALYVLPDSCRNLDMLAKDLFVNFKADVNSLKSRILRRN